MHYQKIIYSDNNDPDLYNLWDSNGNLIAVRIPKDEIQWYWENYLAEKEGQLNLFKNKHDTH